MLQRARGDFPFSKNVLKGFYLSALYLDIMYLLILKRVFKKRHIRIGLLKECKKFNQNFNHCFFLCQSTC